MRKRLCTIVGIDGFDPDVLANLVTFYQGCGYHTRISRVPLDCDLLVIHRGPYAGELFDTRAASCHIYDYAAHGTSDFHLAFPRIPDCRVIVPGTHASGRQAPPRQVHGLHPVVTALWRARRRTNASSRYDLIHIGHRKPNPDGDALLSAMDEVAKSGRCHFWGNGWASIAPDASMVHGPATLHDCQQIYRNSRRAIGVMYPFQRWRTFSGRMWQAPLNGCRLLSEAIPTGASLPGVALYEDCMSVVDVPSAGGEPQRLIDEACDYWDSATSRLAAALDLRYIAPSGWALRAAYFKWIYARHLQGLLPRGVATRHIKARWRSAL